MRDRVIPVRFILSRFFAFILLLMLLSACGVVASDNTVGTLEADLTDIAQESARIQQGLQVEYTQLAATVEAASTQAADLAQSNRVLQATLRAGQQPTPVVVRSNEVVAVHGEPEEPSEIRRPGGSVSTSPQQPRVEIAGDSELSFTDTITARSVRQSDGCAETTQTQFVSSDDRIYLTTRAINLPAGTRLMVEWMFEGQLAATSEWVSPQFNANICLWFFIESSGVTFSPGNWSAILLANDRQMVDPVSFTIIGG